jgi:hypothetical protein
MWQSENNYLQKHLETSSTINSQALVVAEWNLNIAENIDEIGNYRNRPDAEVGDDDYIFSGPKTNFVSENALTATKHYFGATDSDVVVDGGFKDDGTPQIFISKKDKMKTLFSLEDCLGRFRPRSGINKAIYFDGQYLNRVHPDMARQPRFYFGTANDNFKYWTSLRTEGKTATVTATVTKVGKSKSTSNGWVTTVYALNSFDAGDYVSIQGVNKASVSTINRDFVILTATSTYFKVYGLINSTAGTVTLSENGEQGTATVDKSFEDIRGVSYRSGNKFFIDDAAPFVVYKNSLPSNRLVVKMQTKVGDIDAAPSGGYIDEDGNAFDDPFYDTSATKAVPLDWKIQVLNAQNNWVDAVDFSGDNNIEIPSDGYVELAYGLIVPDEYTDSLIFAPQQSSFEALPISAPEGYAYLVPSTSGPGTYYVANGNDSGNKVDNFDSFTPEYGWYLHSETPSRTTSFIDELTSPPYYMDGTTKVYRDIQYVKGMRIVVDSMTIDNVTFDLIEMSPRLAANLTDKITSISVTKHASDLGSSGMPVGQLLASTGSLDMFDYDQAFNPNNPDSLISYLQTKNLQVKFYESIYPDNGMVYHVPIKTLYAESFPETSASSKHVSVKVRDLFFHLEKMKAPELIIPNCSLSMAVSCLLDSIGFSNYTFRRIGQQEPVIPYFIVGPNTTIGQVLNDLAVSTQTAMFFDETNNLVLMTKEYMMPSETERATSMTLRGENEIIDNQVHLTNIAQLESQSDDVHNSGKITYETKYIQRSYSSLSQANVLDAEKTWVYKPVLLWEVSPGENTKAWNDESGKQSSYTLAAIPLDTTLSSDIPFVENGVVVNNTMDLGEAVYWLSRYNGYFYANGEIIKFDAVQYSTLTDGNVWISSPEEYQKYFATMPFGGKMYPTGLVRIYSEPYYDATANTLKNGKVAKHGRGQFGTSIVEHQAGLSSGWTDEKRVKKCKMVSTLMFNGGNTGITYQNVAAGVLTDWHSVKTATASGIMKNYLSSKEITETQTNKKNATTPGTVQSSALILDGPTYPSTVNPQDYIQYVTNPTPLDNRFVHYSTRMRVVGSMENQQSRTQTPVGSMPYYSVQDDQGKAVNVGGSSGGIGIWVDPTTNAGYYYEIVALTDTESKAYTATASAINTIFFYKIQSRPSDGLAVPIVLWSGMAPILVDDGRFTGQSRMVNEKNPTVYDISVEYQKSGTGVKFFMYLNGSLVGSVVDADPLNKHNNIALFTRGSSRIMFENVSALATNAEVNPSSLVNAPVANVFGMDNTTASTSMNKFALSGAIKSTFLTGVNAGVGKPEYNIYFEEFGTIMREMAYFNIKYDKAYPALFAKISPTFNNNQGYAVSGFTANAFGAEFLIFNTTDTVLSLDSGSGNYLRIQGVTFTQNSKHDYTVDEFFTDQGNLSDPDYRNNQVYSKKYEKAYSDIKKNRLTYGNKEFTIETPYIQSQGAAEDMMGWLVSKVMQPRKAVGLEIFSTPTLQLGDIVKIKYDEHGISQVSESDESRYVVYSIEYNRNGSGPTMVVHLSEVT